MTLAKLINIFEYSKDKIYVNCEGVVFPLVAFIEHWHEYEHLVDILSYNIKNFVIDGEKLFIYLK